jgi:hypothetical protein
MSRPALPYTDTKPVGAPDFYYCINATFRFLHERLGMDALVEYWTDLGTRYYAPVSVAWREGGLPAVARYWRAFFDAEPGAEVDVRQETDQVTLEVKTCPAFRHLRAGGRVIFPHYCRHCYHVGEAIAAPAGFTLRIEGGAGSCWQVVRARDAAAPPQDLERIREAR